MSNISYSLDGFDSRYGQVSIQPFQPTWLEDYPQVIEHLDAEHLLHVKGKDEEGKGLTWHTTKFSTDMDTRLDPEAKVGESKRGGFQMKIGYFEMPIDNLDTIEALSFSPEIQEDIAIRDQKKNLVGYRFFVHPTAYNHYSSLFKKFHFIPPKESQFIGTPTSSYRSWTVRHVEEDKGVFRAAAKSFPFIVKMGVQGSVLGGDKWLSYNEIDRSVKAQVAFDSFDEQTFQGKDGAVLLVFPETFGMKLKEIYDYGEGIKKSGLLIRQFPKGLLEGKSRIFSMAALMSPERIKEENKGIVTNEQVPLIFEVMEATVKAGKAKDAKDFVEKYLIKMYLDSIEKVLFQEGMTIEPHSQNLCMVLNPDLTPKGYAYRDHGGIWIDIATRGLKDKDITPFYRKEGDDQKVFKAQGAIAKNYLCSYSWFYRYQVFIKTLNLVTRLSDEILSECTPPPPGAPFQIGVEGRLSERNLNRYCIRKLEAEGKTHETAVNLIKKLSMNQEEASECLRTLDKQYYERIDRYFDMEKVNIPLEEGAFPSAEGGSSNEKVMYNHRGFLGKQRFCKLDQEVKPIAGIPNTIMDKLKGRIITSFEDQKIEDLKPVEYLLANKGICFLNERHEIVAFAPYITHGEQGWIKKQIEQQASYK